MKIGNRINQTINKLKPLAVALSLVIGLGAGSAHAATLTWALTGGGTWNTATANWTGDATTFVSNGTQNVVFNKSIGGTITVDASMNPLSTTVNSAGSYTFSGGAITGAGSLTKAGGGTLTMNNVNSYTGKTIVQAGTLLLSTSVYLSNAGANGPLGKPSGANSSIDLHNGVVFQMGSTSPRKNQVTDRKLNLAGTGAGTVDVRVNDNDTLFQFGGVTATGTGPKTLNLYTGYYGNGDREALVFTGPIEDSSDASPTSVSVLFRTQDSNRLSLSAVNTFTGPLTLQTNGPHPGYLVVGGVRAAASGALTVGTGSLANGNYPANIAIGAQTIFEYASTAPQILAGTISGLGALQVSGSGPLTLSGTNTYSGNTTVNSGAALVLASGGDYKFTITDAATNNKITGGGSATLNGNFTLDTSAVTVTSGLWTLVNTNTKSFGGSFSLTGFSGPSGLSGNFYTKSSAGQTWTFNKSTAELSLSSSAIITTFGIPGSTGVINQVTKTIALTVPWTPWGSSGLATLAPTYTVTSGAGVPSSGSSPSSFASGNTASYTVTDGATVNTYDVTVTVTPANTASDMLTCNFGALGPATISGTSAVLTVAPNQPLTALSPTFTLSGNATISPASGTRHDFTNPVIYRVTAEDGSTYKDYSVTVQTYQSWAHSGSLFIITTPDGANLPGGATETNFPLLVRFNSGNFNFAEAQSDGRDIRFTTAADVNLPYQIEQWDSSNSTASVWVKIPTITGNSTQQIKMYWGKTGVASESSGSAVFNATNGYVSVYHMSDTVTDEVGTTSPANSGTTATTGLIGKGRHFNSGNGVNCGTNITGYPTGSNPSSSQAWIRASVANTTVMSWGIDQGQGKVVMQLANPPHMNVDCYFGGGNVSGASTVPLSEWVHVVHTYQSGSAKIYVNGVLDGTNSSGTMNIPSPARMYIGGAWGSYNYAGDMDEVRISKVVRSANWVKLEYENQKPLQTLVGTLVQAGSTFTATPSTVNIPEGTGTTLSGQADGAQKVYWIYKNGAQETVLAVDQLTLDIAASRVTGDQNYVIEFRGIYPSETKTIDVPITISEAIPDPVFTLTGPNTWNGRDTITVTPNISNLAAMQAAGAGTLSYSWSVNGVAVIKQITPGVLTLTRSQGSGPLTVSVVIDNGGTPVTASKIISVQEPASDAWVQRTPDANEKPVANQFFARDPNTNMGTIYYNGTQPGSPATVYLKVYTTDSGNTLYATHRQPLLGGAYSFAAPIAAGKVTYKVVYGTTTGGVDTDVATVSNLICGDAYLIEGQSNALATDNAEPGAPAPSPWIRSYGKTLGWGNAVNKGTELQLGVWGMILAQRLLADNDMPICIINGAVGGTRIDEHQPNPAGHGSAGSLYSIYANLYNRIVGAKLTHGIRGVMWHQGENDQGATGPDGDFDYKFYQQYFVNMTAAWKTDFPNIQNYYIFQIWPAACGDASRNDQLREVQRTLSDQYSNMRVMSTVGIVPGSGCHYVLAGYQVFSDLMAPMLEQDFYGYMPASVFTAANLQQAYFTTPAHTDIALVFDQNMAWNTGIPSLLFLDNVANKVASGSVSGKVVTLHLNAASSAQTITYLKGIGWNGVQGNLLYGSNGIAALTFADVPVAATAPSSYAGWAADPAQGLSAGVNDGALQDPDYDGISNLLEFALGGNPTAASSAILPVLTKTGATWVFEYDRSDLSLPPATTQVVEYGSDLSGWTPLTIPAISAGAVTITPGSPSDHVSVSLPDLGDAGFVRLKVSQ